VIGAVLLIVSALLRREDRICLVEQQAAEDAAPAWMLPGGRVEEGEGVLSALSREVVEETGLSVAGSPRLAFAVEVARSTITHTALTFECRAKGVLSPADPDGLVSRAEWLPQEEAYRRLEEVEWYDVLPLRRYLAGEESAGATYRVSL
jgi:8-oxo-dGTP diphosphatase